MLGVGSLALLMRLLYLYPSRTLVDMLYLVLPSCNTTLAFRTARTIWKAPVVDTDSF